MEDKIIQADFASNNRRLRALEKSSKEIIKQLISVESHAVKELISLENRVAQIEKYITTLNTFFIELQKIK